MGLKSSFNTVQNEVATEKRDLSLRYSAVLDEQLGKQQLEERLANEEKELKERWEREWQEFRVSFLHILRSSSYYYLNRPVLNYNEKLLMITFMFHADK